MAKLMINKNKKEGTIAPEIYADIGSAVGYENQLHFSRAFKNIYGVSPREWRKQNK